MIGTNLTRICTSLDYDHRMIAQNSAGVVFESEATGIMGKFDQVVYARDCENFIGASVLQAHGYRIRACLATLIMEIIHVASGFVHYARMFGNGYYLAEPDVLLLANMVPYHHDRTDPRYGQERESESDEEDEDLPDLIPVVCKLTESEESELPPLLEEDDDDIVHVSRAVMKTGPQYAWYIDDAIEWTERVVGEGGETHAHARPSLQWARDAMKANAQASEGQVRSPVSGLVLERQGLIMEIHAWLDYIVKVNEGSRRPDHVNLMPMTLLSLKKTVMKLKEHIHKIDSTIRMANGGADVPIHEILNSEASDSRWTRVEELDVRWMEGVQPRWVFELGCDVNAAFYQQLMKPDSNCE